MTEVPLQRVDCIADGGRGSPQALGRSGKTSGIDDCEQHQKLICTGCSRISHDEFPENNFIRIYLGWEKPWRLWSRLGNDLARTWMTQPPARRHPPL
jgi:hypothetical protein